MLILGLLEVAIATEKPSAHASDAHFTLESIGLESLLASLALLAVFIESILV